MRWPPVTAALVAVAVGALLVLSGEDAPREPEPDEAPLSTTTTTIVAGESPQLRWQLVGSDLDSADSTGRPAGFSLDSVHDLERDATVVRLRTTHGTGRVSLQDDADVFRRVGETVRFSAWLRTSGSVEVTLFMVVPELTMENRGRPARNLAEASTEDQPVEPGRWVRREASLVVPDRASLVVFGIKFAGDGELAVDDVIDP